MNLAAIWALCLLFARVEPLLRPDRRLDGELDLKPAGTASFDDLKKVLEESEVTALGSPLSPDKLNEYQCLREELRVVSHDADTSAAPYDTFGILDGDFWARKPRKSINFVHFNDVYDIRYFFNFATYLKKYLNLLRSPAVVFSGDIMGPSLVSNTLTLKRGFQFEKFFADIKIDVSVPGNHEMDYTEDNFINFMKINSEEAGAKTAPKAPGRWLLANFRPKDVPKNWSVKYAPNAGNLRGCVILNMNGFKVGLIGLVDEAWMNGSSYKPILDKYVYTPFLDAARVYSRRLKKAGCHFVAAVTHMTNRDDEALLDDSTNEVDFVFGGHEHIFMIARRNNRVLLKSGADFSNFSAIRFELFASDADRKQMYETQKKAGVRDPEVVEKNPYEFTLDELNPELVKIRHWNFPVDYKPPAGDDNKDLAELKFLNIYVERVDVDLRDEKLRDPDFLKDFDSGYMDLIKKYMMPVLKFRRAVDVREPQIYKSETPIGDFITDVIKADTFVDVVMLNAGSLKLEKALPENTELLKADAMRILQRPSVSLKSYPRVKSVNFLFSKYLKNYQGGIPDFPVFSGAKVFITPKGSFAERAQLGLPHKEELWPETSRIHFFSLEYTASEVAKDPALVATIDDEIAALRTEWAQAVQHLDALSEQRALWEMEFRRQATKFYEAEEMLQLDPWDPMTQIEMEEFQTQLANAIGKANALRGALSYAYRVKALVAEKKELEADRDTNKLDIVRLDKAIAEASLRAFFPTSWEPTDGRARPYDSLEKFYSAGSQWAESFLNSGIYKCVSSLDVDYINSLWRTELPFRFSQDAKKNFKSLDCSKMVGTPKTENYDGLNYLSNPAQMALRSVRDREWRRQLNFLAVAKMYFGKVIRTWDRSGYDPNTPQAPPPDGKKGTTEKSFHIVGRLSPDKRSKPYPDYEIKILEVEPRTQGRLSLIPPSLKNQKLAKNYN